MNTSSDLACTEQWTVSETARKAKCTLRTIRFYEQRGLLAAGARTGGRHRRYSPRDLERLRTIIELRRAGMSLGEIRTIIELKRRHSTGAAASAAFREILGSKVSALGARIAELSRIRREFVQLGQGLVVCQDCHADPNYPEACAKCERLGASGDQNRLLRALWSHPA